MLSLESFAKREVLQSGKIWLIAARVAQMLELKTSQLASDFEIPLPIIYLLEAWIRETDL